MLICVGMLINGLSLYLMSRWSLAVEMDQIVWTGVLQGIGMGAIMLPTSTAAFRNIVE